MKKQGAKQQTLMLTAVNAAVRALGLVLRVVMSRLLGAEVMGIAEMAQSIHMLAISPLTSGLPVAISRMTAKAAPENRQKPLWAGIRLVRMASAFLIPLMLLASPLLAKLTGDIRVLPALWFCAPCILVLGYSAACNGYCYGMENSRLPAMSELVEQIGRLLFFVALYTWMKKLTAPWLAALPTFSTLLAELMGLALVLRALKLTPVNASETRVWSRPVLRLAAPMTASRVVQTALRSCTAVMIPLRLRISGLCAAEATARLGMLNGMVMPLLMLPCVFTSALSMVSLPRIVKAENSPSQLKGLLTRCTAATVVTAGACAAGIYAAAPLLANVVFRAAELGDLFRLCAPMTLLFALSHLSGSVISALGQQRRSLWGTVVVSCITLALTYVLTAQPQLRLKGVIAAQTAGQAASILWNAGILLLWRKERVHSRTR